jgi:adenylosuccinate synthase
MIIIDPERRGCTLWSNLNVTTMEGTIEDCVDSIFKRIMIPIVDEENNIVRYHQQYDIGLDVGGIGRAWKDEFKRRNIRVLDIVGKQINNFLPVITLTEYIEESDYDMYTYGQTIDKM